MEKTKCPCDLGFCEDCPESIVRICLAGTEVNKESPGYEEVVDCAKKY